MQIFRYFIPLFLIIFPITGCASTTPINLENDENLPPWVGTPATGSPPHSKKPLPEGVKNGDIVLGQDKLFYFIWENTKSRIWFPATVEEEGIQSLPDGSDMDFHLVGVTKPDSSPGYLVLTDKGNVYWLDTVSGGKFSPEAISLLYEELNSIPTAYGEQYFPSYKK